MTDNTEKFDPAPALEDLGVPVPEPIEVNDDDWIERRPNLIEENPDFAIGTANWVVHSSDGRVGGIDIQGDAKIEGTIGVTHADIRKIIETDIKKGINPKDALGAAKVDPSVVPPSAELHLATAMMDGAVKYGPFNWRDNPVQARVYYAAARRHLSQWLDGEDFDPISNVHHLAHAMACCAIVLDAYENGNLDDNRPTRGASGEMIRSFDTKRRWVDRVRRFFNR